MNNERERFESWLQSQGTYSLDRFGKDEFPPMSDEYQSYRIQMMWLGWQARSHMIHDRKELNYLIETREKLLKETK